MKLPYLRDPSLYNVRTKYIGLKINNASVAWMEVPINDPRLELVVTSTDVSEADQRRAARLQRTPWVDYDPIAEDYERRDKQ